MVGCSAGFCSWVVCVCVGARPTASFLHISMSRKGIILLGGVGQTLRHLSRIQKELYPQLPVLLRPHSLLELVNVRFKHAAVKDRFRRDLDSFPDGAVVHMISSASFFGLHALREWQDERVAGVVCDSIPYRRDPGIGEYRLMQSAGVPEPLCNVAGKVARQLLLSPLFDATEAYTDRYNALQKEPRTFHPRRANLLMAHSTDDAVVPIEEFRDHCAALRASEAWAGHELDVFEGRGPHALMAREDSARFAAAMAGFLGKAGLLA